MRGGAARLEQDVHADDTGHQERLGVQDGPVDVRFRGEIDDGVGVADEVVDDLAVGDVTDDERQARRQFRVRPDRCEVGLVAGVRQLVEDGDLGAVAPIEDVADVARADEPGAAGHEQATVVAPRFGGGVRHPIGRSDGGARRPISSSSRASSAARSSDGTVPASVQWPS